MAWTQIIPLLSVVFLQYAYGETTSVTVKTSKGSVEGMNVPANAGTTNVAFDAFLGIPYGDKPDRFQLAKSRTAWADTLKAQTDSPPCPQISDVISEDCLFLNVYTPEGASTSTIKLPVLVFVPGGDFTTTTASSKIYGPDFLISTKIILVTINYRVGATGFLSLGSKAAPGNLGLHDTLLALQWIHDEISVFGGDPTQVTLFGEGAGAVITQFHYLSPLSTGLFTRAITQSGSAKARWGYVTATEARNRALQFAKKLKCDTSQSDSNILTCLQTADITSILTNQLITLSDYDKISGRDLPFVPVLDTNATADNPFFSDSLDKLIEAAISRAKPLMSGFTSDEGVIMFGTDSYLKAEGKLEAFLPEETGNTNKVNQIKTHYFNQSSPSLNKIQSLVSLYTDYLYANPAVQLSRVFANFTYGYEFAYDGTWKSQDLKTNNEFYKYNMRAVAHGEGLSYLFYNTKKTYQLMDTCEANSANINMKNNMVKWWSNFAKTGIPDDSWTTVAKGGYFVIDTQTSVKNVTVFENQYYNFWASMQTTTTSSAVSATVTSFTLFLSPGAVIMCFYL